MAGIFKTRFFAKWARKAKLPDGVLCAAVEEMRQGLVDADLGGNVYKKRVPMPGRGKSGGARTLLATNRHDRWFFVFGFPKSERANITALELQSLQMLAEDLLGQSEPALDAMVRTGSLEEICHDEKTQPDS